MGQGDTPITVIGNLTGDPELRFTPQGTAVANFTVASTPRTFDKNTNEWRDGETLFVRCNVWRQPAEHVAESLMKGTRVVVQGNLKARTWETREGEKRTNWELEVEEIGASLKYATVKVTRTERATAGHASMGSGGRTGGAQASQDPWANNDPWAAPGSGGGEEPPF